MKQEKLPSEKGEIFRQVHTLSLATVAKIAATELPLKLQLNILPRRVDAVFEITSSTAVGQQMQLTRSSASAAAEAAAAREATFFGEAGHADAYPQTQAPILASHSSLLTSTRAQLAPSYSFPAKFKFGNTLPLSQQETSYTRPPFKSWSSRVFCICRLGSDQRRRRCSRFCCC